MSSNNHTSFFFFPSTCFSGNNFLYYFLISEILWLVKVFLKKDTIVFNIYIYLFKIQLFKDFAHPRHITIFMTGIMAKFYSHICLSLFLFLDWIHSWSPLGCSWRSFSSVSSKSARTDFLFFAAWFNFYERGNIQEFHINM